MDSKEIRRRNLLYLADVKYNRRVLAEKLGYGDSSYLNQLAAQHSKMGDRTAKKIEQVLGLDDGWMDTVHPNLWDSQSHPIKAVAQEIFDSYSDEDLWILIQLIQEELRSRQKPNI